MGLAALRKPKQSLFTVDEYLELERQAEERHEYMDGDIQAMAGESPFHGASSVNVVALLVIQLKGTRCQVFTKDMKVRSGPTPVPHRNKSGLYSYPDVVVACGELEFHDEKRDVLLNPSVIIEVLSESTEEFDRGEKAKRLMMWNRTLKDLLLISQDRPQIDQFHRKRDRKWVPRQYTGLDTKIALSSIKCVLPLADVFDRVKFPSPDEKLPKNSNSR